MTPPAARNPTKSDGTPASEQEQMLKRFTEQLGRVVAGVQKSTSELVSSVTDLTETVRQESAQARELAREDRAEFYRVLREESVLARQAAVEEAERRSREALGAFRERRPDGPRLPQIVSVAEEFDAVERLEQRGLVLTYNAWRTMLGRAQAASVFQATRGFGEDDEPNVIRIHAAPFDETGRGWTLALTLDTGKVLRAELLEGDRPPCTVQVSGLRREMTIRRLEIRDERGNPLYLGLGPAVQLQHWQPEPDLVELTRADDEDR
jgi:hypothetical protein